MSTGMPAFSRGVTSTSTRTPLPGFHLSGAALANVSPSQYSVYHVDNVSAPNPAFAPCIAVEFHNLSPEQLEALRNVYSGWASPAAQPHLAVRTIGLVDVLPPLISALDGYVFTPNTSSALAELPVLKPKSDALDFDPDEFKMGSSRSEQAIQEQMNCFGYVLNLLRLRDANSEADAQRVGVSAPDPEVAWAALTDEDTSDLLLDGFNWETSSERIKPGDYLLVYHSFGEHAWLDHAAMFVDRFLLAEKAGSGPGTPFRLVDLPTLALSWNATPGVFKYQVRRPKSSLSGENPPFCPYKTLSAHSVATLATFPHLEHALPSHRARNLGVTRVLGDGMRVESGIWTVFRETEALVFDPADGRPRLPHDEVRLHV